MIKEVYGYIYVITNKINNKKYIGQTTNDFNIRYNYSGKTDIERVYRWHLYKKEKGGGCNDHLLFSIEKYGFNNWIVEKEFYVVYKHKNSQSELDFKEEYYIRIYNTTNPNYGYNKLPGGKNHSHSEETKRKISDRPYAIGGNHANAKKIVLLNKKEIFNSLSEAVRKYDIPSGNISNCLLGTFTHAGTICTIRGVEDMVWVYYEEYIKMTEEEIQNKISIKPYIICLNTGKYFKNGGEAGSFYGCNRSDILKVCNKKRKTCGKLNGKRLRWAYLKFNHNKKYRLKQ